MTNKKTLYHFVLDQSSSMWNIINETLAGYNQQIETVRALAQQYPDQAFLMSRTIFSTKVESLQKPVSHDQMEALSRLNYTPNGMTALLDAIGESIEMITEEQLEEFKNIHFVVFTDGEENSSVKHSAQAIQKRIQELRTDNKWTFNFIGVEVDLNDLANQIGLQAKEFISISHNEMVDCFDDLSADMRSMAKEVDVEIKSERLRRLMRLKDTK